MWPSAATMLFVEGPNSRFIQPPSVKFAEGPNSARCPRCLASGTQVHVKKNTSLTDYLDGIRSLSPFTFCYSGNLTNLTAKRDWLDVMQFFESPTSALLPQLSGFRDPSTHKHTHTVYGVHHTSKTRFDFGHIYEITSFSPTTHPRLISCFWNL